MVPIIDRPADIAQAVLDAHDERRQIAPITQSDPEFDLVEAYKVTARVRELRTGRGERVVGRKIGFTNRTIWPEYGVYAPIWGYVYDDTLHSLADGTSFDLSTVVEPRIEPEIAFGLARAPEPGMDEEALLGCIDFVSHGFEIVQSLFPAWNFKAADTVAAFGLHGTLLLGPRQTILPADRPMWLDRLARFEITLSRDGVAQDRGHASNVLGGGPLAALRHLVEVLAGDRESPSLQPGEVVTTGTLTRALPIAPAETWSTELSGLPLPGVAVTFR